MTPGDVTPTEDQLRAAYARLYRAPRWPTTLADALAHPQYGLAVRAVARRMGLQPAAAPAPAPEAPRPPATTQPPAARPRRDGFDPKRAAAHDLD